MSYQPKVYRKQGGDELVVASGGLITVETGGDIEFNGDSAAAAVAIIADIPTTDPGDGVSIWLDEGVLKVSTLAEEGE